MSRAGFLDWLGHNAEVQVSQPIGAHAAGRSSISVVWLTSGGDDDPIVAVPASELRDFLAFVATYVGSHVPFTAFFRVVASELLESLPRRRATSHMDSFAPYLGAMIADAASQIGSAATRASDISIQACLAAPSATVVTAVKLGYDNDVALVALDRWYSIRQELVGGPGRLAPLRLRAFWSVALAVLNRSGGLPSRDLDPQQAQFLEVAGINEDNSPEDALGQMSLWLPNAYGLGAMLRGSREDRVRALDSIRNSLTHSNASMELREMILGYAAAKVADGSLNYLQLASRYVDDLPMSLMWFGIFSGLHHNNDMLTAADCLGRRVTRHLRQSTGRLPLLTADVGFEEFLLLNGEGRISKIRTDQQSVIDVELLPGVSGRFRFARGIRREDESRRDDNVRSDGSAATLDAAKKLVAQLNALLREGEASSGNSPGPLFDTSKSSASSTSKPKATRRKPK